MAPVSEETPADTGQLREEPPPTGEPAEAQAAPVSQKEPPPAPGPRPSQPASQASIQQAIEDVTRVVDSLREALEDMEEVLETVELAERQKSADEHEIESLRRALRQLQRGNSQPRGHSPEGH
jgi:hypothetical protein